MGKTVQAYKAVNANVAKVRQVDLDASSDASEVGTIPAAAAPYVVATEYGSNSFHKTVFTCTAVPVSVTDDPGVAQYGGVQLYTMPLGGIVTLGASISGSLTLGTTGTIIAAFTGVNALGTVTATTGASLTSTEATWLQSTANATASAKVAAISSISVATALTESPGRVVDGRTTAAPVFLNFAIADDVSHTAGTGSFTGTVTIVWAKIS